MKGYRNKLLVIDLNESTAKIQEIPDEWFEEYIGGEGTAIRLLSEHVTPELDKFDPSQPIIFSTGPLTGTSVPS
ncbi:MAG: aldehyde ferredoxin oxidoreductase N-terminal domain-containing protein, partial [Candidatus Saliniplasma sp.]